MLMEENNSALSLPYCNNLCSSSSDPNYQTYNMIVSGIVLFAVALIGFVGNTLVVLVYFGQEQRVHSTSIYLGALGASDFLMICTAMFLFVLEAWRHHGHPLFAIIYGLTAEYVFPFGAIFQTTSVYFCVGAAIDAFIYVVLPEEVKNLWCTSKRAKKFVLIMSFICLLYNIPHFYELRSIPCIDSRINEESLQVCPTAFRMNVLYYTIYYTYMYTVFMAVGPLLLLIVLNILVIYYVIRRPKNPESDIISLILVVCFFIFCNFAALVVNFLELTMYEQLGHILAYFVDLSNLLVVINCTANFFVYLIFSKSFRRSLIKLLSCELVQPNVLSNSKSENKHLIWVDIGDTNNCNYSTQPLSSPSNDLEELPEECDSNF